MGVTCSCSRVPSSRSRTIEAAVKLMSVKVRMIASRPGMMKLAVRRSGLYQGRTRRSTGSSRSRQPRLHGELLHRGGGRDARRHRHRLRRGRRVRGVDDQQRVRRLVAPAILAEVAIDDQGDRRLRRIEGAAQLVHRGDAADQVEVLARLHPRHELAALVRSRFVEHHHRQVLDVEVDRVAEDRHLHQRHHDDHPQRQVVARQLAELLDGERDQASHARPSLPASRRPRCSRTSDTNASSSVGSAAATVPSFASAGRIASSPPGAATARSATPSR